MENFDLTVTNIVTAYAGSSTQLAERAKMLSKSLANVLSTEGESLQEIDDMQEWQQISTWSQISRCFSFVDDIDAVQVPEHIIDVLTEELQVLEAGVFPTGKYERPTDVREEMQQVGSQVECLFSVPRKSLTVTCVSCAGLCGPVVDQRRSKRDQAEHHPRHQYN